MVFTKQELILLIESIPTEKGRYRSKLINDFIKWSMRFEVDGNAVIAQHYFDSKERLSTVFSMLLGL